MAARSAFRQAEAELLKFALGYPAAWEDRPWGERVVKVKKKVFVFLGVPSDGLHVTVKLPQSATLALGLPFVAPTGYGLGRAGWVTATIAGRRKPPLPMLKQWIDESYRAVAPVKLAAQASGARLRSGPSARPARVRRRSRSTRPAGS